MILEQIIDHAVQTPTAVAIVDDKRTLTYRELVFGFHLMVDHVETLAPLAAAGDKIGLLIPPSSAFAIALGGTRWANRIALPLNYLLKPDELAAVIQDAGLKVIFSLEFFKPLGEATNAILTAAGYGPVQFIPMETLEFKKPGLLAMAAIAANPAAIKDHLRPVPARAPDDVAIILYTSGTSGTPKGVMLTNENLESNARDSVTHARFTEKTIFLGILPMFHALGLQANCLIPMMLGCKVVYQARFSPVGVFEAFEKHGCKVIVAVPTLFSLLAAAKSAKPDSMKTLEYALSGGEPLPVALIEAFKAKFGITLLEGFGLTETSPIVALNTPWDFKPGAVGKLIPHVKVRMISDDGQTLTAPNQDGELLIQGPNVMKGYYHKPELTADVLVEEKEGAHAGTWFKTGDIARLDEDGYLYITGRKKDMIIMAGEKVFPREIEDAIKHHPAVLHVAVIGVKDSSRGEAPVAFVQLKADLPANEKPSANDLRSFVRERIAPYKTPRDVYFIEDMPRSATGKVLKRELKIPAGA